MKIFSLNYTKVLYNISINNNILYITPSHQFPTGYVTNLKKRTQLINWSHQAKQRYIIEDDRTLVLHFLKARNGDARMSFFKAKFEKMEIEEMDTPDTQERR